MNPVLALYELGGAGRRELVLAAGVTKASVAGALRRGLIERKYRGVYSIPGTPEYVIDARMYRGQVTCVSWALHCGLPLLEAPTKSHLLVPRDRGRRHDDRRPSKRVVLHRSQAVASGLYAEPLAALADLASCLEPNYLIAVADSAVAKGLIARDELYNLPHATKRLREWLALSVDQRSQSFIESLTRHALAGEGYDVRPQVHFKGVGDVDFVIGNVIVECDGYEFHHELQDFANDRRRDQLLSAMGFTVLRFTYWDCVYRMDHLLSTVAKVSARVN